MHVHFTIDPADKAEIFKLIQHVNRIDVMDLGGMTLVTSDVHGVYGNVFDNHPKVKVQFPGPNGKLDDTHVAELNKSKHLNGQHKKGDSMRDALSTIYARTGHPGHNPDWA